MSKLAVDIQIELAQATRESCSSTSCPAACSGNAALFPGIGYLAQTAARVVGIAGDGTVWALRLQLACRGRIQAVTNPWGSIRWTRLRFGVVPGLLDAPSASMTAASRPSWCVTVSGTLAHRHRCRQNLAQGIAFEAARVPLPVGGTDEQSATVIGKLCKVPAGVIGPDNVAVGIVLIAQMVSPVPTAVNCHVRRNCASPDGASGVCPD